MKRTNNRLISAKEELDELTLVIVKEIEIILLLSPVEAMMLVLEVRLSFQLREQLQAGIFLSAMWASQLRINIEL